MADAGEHRHVNPWIVAIAVMLGTFMEVLDTSVVNVSLPHIAGSLSATIDEATWTVTSYLVANAIILPMTGWLASTFGRKRLLMLSVVGFTAASFLCGLAPTLGTLIFFRVVQGATGGALQPLSQAVLLEAFPPEDRGKAMGFWGLGVVVAPILGPVLGGWLTDSYSWRWVFYINIPVGIASLVMTKMFIFDPSYLRQESRKVDYWGIGMLAVGIGALQILLDKGQEADWFSSNFMTALAVIATVTLISFVIYELVVEDPVVDLRVFKERSYAVGVFLMTVVGFVLYGSLVLLPIMLQTLLGYPALEAGIAMAPRGVGSFFMMPITGIMTGKYDARKLLTAGLVIGGFTLVWLSWLNLQAGYWDIFWPQIIQGAGLSLLFVPLTTVSMDKIPREKMGNATSLFNLMRNIGGSIGIAVTGTMIARHTQQVTATLGEHVNVYSYSSQQMFLGMRAAFMAAGADAVTATNRAYAAIFGMLARQASMVSFVGLFQLLGIIFIVIIPLVLLMKRPGGGPAVGAH
ncbi:MAG TPA: DHA2 family efflux MFS transporter permease subunit [Vicinamibacterales bacterium]|nr:DHA2 family efflux MFS transporter permease subunit [Vicinamibacterales bacterium]